MSRPRPDLVPTAPPARQRDADTGPTLTPAVPLRLHVRLAALVRWVVRLAMGRR